MADQSSIYVTKPVLPPLKEFLPYLEEIWANRWLTNGGPFHYRLETELAAFLGVDHLALVSNGTIGLLIALQALHITGEVITTPFSFVATSHALLWNNARPVFADIDPLTCNLDPARIEAAITPQTNAILPVHCYGAPCDTDEIQRIAGIYGLRVIYDAAHAFGVRRNGRSILSSGDLSVLSFHATKVFNTFEGGAIVCPDAKMKQRVDYLKNFGFADEVTVTVPGINGKMNEFQAALGLAQLNYFPDSVLRRRRIAAIYREELAAVPGISCIETGPAVSPNYSYFPMLVGTGFPLSRDGLYQKLSRNGISARRYFYPLISNMPMYRNLPSARPENLPVATRIAQQILCLPIYPDLTDAQAKMIASIVAAG